MNREFNNILFFLFLQSSKPLMEKRRRARINQSLNELKNLILEAMKKDVSQNMMCNTGGCFSARQKKDNKNIDRLSLRFLNWIFFKFNIARKELKHYFGGVNFLLNFISAKASDLSAVYQYLSYSFQCFMGSMWINFCVLSFRLLATPNWRKRTF